MKPVHTLPAFWLSILLVTVAIVSFLFYIDDWGYPKSNDSIQLTITMFLMYTALIGGFLYVMAYVFLAPVIDRIRRRK